MSNQRIEQIRSYMERKELDLTILCLSENIVLVSEAYWPRNGLALAMIPKKGKPVLLVPKPELEDTNQVESFEVHTFGCVKLSEGNSYDNIVAAIKVCQSKWSLPSKVAIGIELDPQIATPALCDGEIILPGNLTKNAVKNSFEDVRFLDILPCISWLRKNKLSFEQHRIEKANRVAHDGLTYFKELLDKGEKLTEIQLASNVEAYIAQNAHKYDIRYARAWAQVSSGIKTADAWNAGIVTSSRAIEKGDLVMIEMGTIADGYFCDLTMTYTLGETDRQRKTMLMAVEEAQIAALQTIKAGIMAREVDQAAREVLEHYQLDSYFVHGTGHGTGFAYHDGSPYLSPSSEDILETGMIHSVEPGVYIPGFGGVRFEVNVLVTNEGCVILGK